MEEEKTLKDPLQEETQTKDDPLEEGPLGKTHQKEADPLEEDHPLEEDCLLVWIPSNNRRSNQWGNCPQSLMEIGPSQRHFWMP